MMEKLPTELMVEVMGCSNRPTIHSFTIVSSKYREIAQPLLFRRITINVMACERLNLLVRQLENGSKLASMIKTLIIGMPFNRELLRRLLAVVSNLEELFMHREGAYFLLSPHDFPNLRRLDSWAPRPGDFNDVVANFIPCHKDLDHLKVSFSLLRFNSDSATLCMPPLAESVSSGVDRLVTYQGPISLLPLLTPNSKVKHLTSSQQLDEGTLRKLSSNVSGGLLSLIVDDPIDRFKSDILPGSLIPSLFPTLRSIAWLSLDVQSTSVIDQLPHLRRVWFTSMHAWPKYVKAIVTKIQELIDMKTRPLQEIYVYSPIPPISYKSSKASISNLWVLQTGLQVVPFVG